MAIPETPFWPAVFGPEVAKILALDQNGQRLMPLASGSCSSEEARRLIQTHSSHDLFPGAFSPEGAQAGLFLYFSCLEEAHRVAQDLPTAEGSFWHGIMHRQEPDPENAAYWFRRVGRHAVFSNLRVAAAEILERYPKLDFSAESRWDPFRFIEFCESARRRP